MPHSFSWYTCEHIIHFTTYFICLCHFRFIIKTVLLQLQLYHYFSCSPTYTSKTTYEPGTTTQLKNNIHIFFLSFFLFSSLLFFRFSFLCNRGGVSDASQHHFSFYSTCDTRSHVCCSFLSLIHDA
jgi:hypothetical protein